jgi:small subunit ribosomal protein S3
MPRTDVVQSAGERPAGDGPSGPKGPAVKRVRRAAPATPAGGETKGE